MTLFNKLMKIYSTLTLSDFDLKTGTINLQNDGEGDYIAKWEHPTLTQPTEDQLNAI